MNILETDRLTLRELEESDASFIHRLMNDPEWLRHIGDKGIHAVEDACRYINSGARAMYARHGFGLWLVERKEGQDSLGICGLLKRDALEEVDLGFAFLPEYRGLGYAHEAAAATIEYGRREFALPRLAAIMSPANDASGRLLARLGFQFARMIRLTPESPEIKLFLLDL